MNCIEFNPSHGLVGPLSLMASFVPWSRCGRTW